MKAASEMSRPGKIATGFRTVASGLCVVVAAALVFFQIYAVSDLWSFEPRYIVSLFGISGILVVLVLNAGFLFLAWRGLRHRSLVPGSAASRIFLVLWALVLFWFLDWMFLADPLTLKMRLLFAKNTTVDEYHPKADGSTLAALIGGQAPAFPGRAGVMLDRIIESNPGLYRRNDVVPTIVRFANQYDVDPLLLFFLNYIDSWYVKATPGKIPFFAAMTPQIVRTFVQVHLPSWVVESPVRIYLATSNFYESILGKTTLAWQLREFAHKFTLDASISPYALNTFSDVLLVMKEFPNEFPELRGDRPCDQLCNALREAFFAISATTLRTPYEEPYLHAPYGPDYYDAQRENLKKFSRAVFYKLMFDFEFGTRVQALFAKYNEKLLREAVGDDVWNALDRRQRLAMLAMPRDMFTPNVGRLGENLYTLCEINCTTIWFVAEGARQDLDGLKRATSIWRPEGYDKLYAGATFRLRVLSEVWQAFYGTPLPGLGPTDTVSESLRIIQ
jgi:hypothetical protein